MICDIGLLTYTHLCIFLYCGLKATYSFITPNVVSSAQTIPQMFRLVCLPRPQIPIWRSGEGGISNLSKSEFPIFDSQDLLLIPDTKSNLSVAHTETFGVILDSSLILTSNLSCCPFCLPSNYTSGTKLSYTASRSISCQIGKLWGST